MKELSGKPPSSYTIEKLAMKPSKPPEEQYSDLYAGVLAQIMKGEFAPGSRLVEEELARTYNVSRTPIREVLFALERDGLVERTRNRGARVASFTADDVEEIYEIRKALECAAIGHANGNVKLADLLQLAEKLEKLKTETRPKWKEEQAAIDMDLHRLIVAASANRRMIAYLENISVLIHSLRLLGYRDEAHARQAGEEHLQIVKALLRRDVREAQQLLSSHLEQSKRNALEIFLQKRTTPVLLKAV